MVTDQRVRRGRTPRSARDDGLLTRFIREKLAQHVEPTRLGTPRGAPIGFSRKKMAAALFALTTADVKQTANDVRVSYGLVRKWRTEAAFKALVGRLEDDFVERFCAAVDSDLGGLASVPDTPRGTGPPRRAAPRADLGDLGALAPGPATPGGTGTSRRAAPRADLGDLGGLAPRPASPGGPGTSRRAPPRADAVDLGGLAAMSDTPEGAETSRRAAPRADLGDLGGGAPGPDTPEGTETPRPAAPPDFGVPIPVWELGLPRDAELDRVVDAIYTRRGRWVATNLGDVRLYAPRVMGKLAQHLLDEREGMGRPGRMSVAHALAVLRHQAVPSPEMLKLSARALFGIVRFIVLALESASSLDRRQLAVDYPKLARVYLGVLQRQLVEHQP
jgi:hypothetical protein